MAFRGSRSNLLTFWEVAGARNVVFFNTQNRTSKVSEAAGARWRFYPRIMLGLSPNRLYIGGSNLRIQVQYLVTLKGDTHWKWHFICDTDQSWHSFCVAGPVFFFIAKPSEYGSIVCHLKLYNWRKKSNHLWHLQNGTCRLDWIIGPLGGDCTAGPHFALCWTFPFNCRSDICIPHIGNVPHGFHHILYKELVMTGFPIPIFVQGLRYPQGFLGSTF